MSARAQDDIMKLILERMDRIETELKSIRRLPASESSRAPSHGRWGGRSSQSNPGNCWNCGGEGHLARDCPTPKKPRQQQGNGKASSVVSQALEGEHQAHVSTRIPTLSVTSGKDCVLEGLVNGVPTSILIDTGAATSVLNRDLWDKAKQDGSELGDAEGRKLAGVQGKPLQLYGSACVQVQLAAEKFPIEVMVAETPTVDMIIGRDFL